MNVHALKLPNHSQLVRKKRNANLAISGIWRLAVARRTLSQSSVSLLSVVTTKYSTLSRASVKLPKKLKIAVLLRLKSAPSRFHLNATASSIQLSDSQEIPIRVKQAQNGTKKLVTASQCLKFLMKSYMELSKVFKMAFISCSPSSQAASSYSPIVELMTKC